MASLTISEQVSLLNAYEATLTILDVLARRARAEPLSAGDLQTACDVTTEGLATIKEARLRLLEPMQVM